MAQKLSNGMVKIYLRATGAAVEMHPIDARTALKQTNLYMEYKGKVSEVQKTLNKVAEIKDVDVRDVDLEPSMSENADDIDITSLSRIELIKYAKDTFQEDLNIRWGENRLRAEIEKIRELRKEQVPDLDEAEKNTVEPGDREPDDDEDIEDVE